MFHEIPRLIRRMQGVLPYFPKAFRLVHEAAGRWVWIWCGLLILEGTVPAALIFVVKMLVDSLTSLIVSGNESYQTFLKLVIFLIALQLFSEIVRVAAGWAKANISERVEDHITNLVHLQSTRLDLSFYESPAFLDHLHLARYDARWQPFALLENTGSLLQHSVTLTAMAIVLIRFGAIVPLALIASTLPALIVVMRYTKLNHQWRLRTAAEERKSWYYDWLITDPKTAGEIRLFSLGDFFRRNYRKVRERIRSEHLALLKGQSYAELFAGLSGYLISGVTLIWIVNRTFRGMLTLGDVALFYQAFHQGQSMMRSLLANLGQIYGNSLFLEKFFEYLALQPQIVDPPSSKSVASLVQKDIFFDQVTFRYPGSERLALQDFNLTIPAGKVIAIVGPNGAGKSTLIKLLCRLYDPDAGKIMIDGHDLRHFRVEELRKKITVLFQEPVHYNCSVEENIRLGDLESDEMSRVPIAAEAARADSFISSLPQQYETVLGKWFGNSTDLSVGEWQRLCLARAFFRQASILLLDEPTSAMDSWAEGDWMSRFRQLVQGRTGIIITHRFTMAMQADLIHVIDNGRIIESGRHSQLILQNGFYARSWSQQMQTAEGV